jgi:DNA-binding transcriptional ArsR family regulator
MKAAKTKENPMADVLEMVGNAGAASHLLKAIANENRLLMLCLLAEGEKSVSEIENALGLRQPTVSQQLARLRADELVNSRRDGKTIHYSLASEEVRRVMKTLDELFQFCAPANRRLKHARRTIGAAAE